ncbi:C13 family peptidase [Noviherbaspirillum sp. ST9]|uniref:C13 family peptidase n=1 Tax=Noviherbaspirillum sp. ST9 TaxID=3401606 RepID=UPI003B5877A0
MIEEEARVVSQKGLSGWLGEGARTALFLPARWEGLTPSPGLVALLVLYGILLNLAFERLTLPGPAVFEWRTLASGWLPTLVAAWTCYLMRGPTRTAAHLFGMVLAQSLFVSLVAGATYVVLVRANLHSARALGEAGMWALWLGPALWAILAQVTLLSRDGAHHSGRLLLAASSLVAASALQYAVQPAGFWTPADDDLQEQRRRLSLTQELMEAQPQLLAQRLREIPKQRPGAIDVYAITFAPYSDEDVFLRESAMVSDVMARRFGAKGVQLVNHVQTVNQWPWATPRNLQRAIQRVAEVMDRNEDILFLHLTSHGAKDGQLTADFWPMTVTPVHPAELKAWLDQAGIRHRVISISACYSGSWIPALAGDSTLVMTAADAEHTSYGCGRGSELTFFGRAMFDEQLRNNTLSFESAHAAARDVIKNREEEAGKDDGYSNPQISVGTEIRPRLARLEQQLKNQLPR